MAGTIDENTRAQEQQEYQEHLRRLEQQEQDRVNESKYSQQRQDTLDSLNELREERSTPTPPPTPQSKSVPEGKESAEDKMKAFEKKSAGYRSWGGMAALPLIGKDNFAPMFGGSKFAENAREYQFIKRSKRYERSARVDERQSNILAGRLDPTKQEGVSDSDVKAAAKEQFFARRYQPLNENEASRFADIKLSKNAKTPEQLRDAQHGFLGIRRPEDGPSITDTMRFEAAKTVQEAKIKGSAALGMDAPNISQISKPSDPISYSSEQLSDMVKSKASKDFTDSQSGVRSTLGKMIYGGADERHGVLKNLPVDLSSDTMTGRALGSVGTAAGNVLPAIPAVSVGLGSAKTLQKLKGLREDRHLTGKTGKVAEAGLTTQNLIRSSVMAPAATLMAAPLVGAGIRGAGSVSQSLIGGTGGFIGDNVVGNSLQGIGSGIGAVSNVAGNAIESVGHAGYRVAKDGAMGLSSAVGGGVLSAASGASNLLTGGGMNLGASLAGAAKGVGVGASMAGMAPALIGGLTMALPGMIGGMASAAADKKRRITRGFKQPTDKLVKQFSRSRGIDGVIRNLFSGQDITSDRMLELQLLMYIEQNTSSIPKLVADTGLMSDRQEKDSNATVNAYEGRALTAEAGAGDEGKGRSGKIFGLKVAHAADRALTATQEFSHAINLPGQIMDLLVQGKSPLARKEEFEQQKQDAIFKRRMPEHIEKISKATGLSRSHVQLLTTPASQLIRQTGAESSEGHQTALLSGIYDLLRFEFKTDVQRVATSKGIDLKLDVGAKDRDMKGIQRIMHMIPVISSLASAVESTVNVAKFIGKGVSKVKAGTDGLLQGGNPNWRLGKEQQEKLDSSEAVKASLGLNKSDAEKRDLFGLNLPDLWSQSIYIAQQSLDALNNIFNVQNAILKASTGKTIDFEKSGAQRKTYDAHSGEYLKAQEYNKLIKDRKDKYTAEMSSVKPGIGGRIARRILFGTTKADAESMRDDVINQQLSGDKNFQNTVENKASSAIMRPGIIGRISSNVNQAPDDTAPVGEQDVIVNTKIASIITEAGIDITNAEIKVTNLNTSAEIISMAPSVVNIAESELKVTELNSNVDVVNMMASTVNIMADDYNMQNIVGGGTVMVGPSNVTGSRQQACMPICDDDCQQLKRLNNVIDIIPNINNRRRGSLDIEAQPEPSRPTLALPFLDDGRSDEPIGPRQQEPSSFGPIPFVGSHSSVTGELGELDRDREEAETDASRGVIKDGFAQVMSLLTEGVDVAKSVGKNAVDKGKGLLGGLLGKLTGMFGGIFGKIAGIAATVMKFSKILLPLLAGAKVMKMFEKSRSDGDTPEEQQAAGTGAFGKTTDTVGKAGMYVAKVAAHAGEKKLTQAMAKPILEKGLKETIKTAAKKRAVKGALKVFKPATTEAGKLALKKATKVAATKGAIIGGAKEIGKIAVKSVAKAGGAGVKSFFKKIPAVGFAVGLGLGAYRGLAKGDWTGAAMEVASGATSFFPGPGWVAGLAIDAALLTRDIAHAISETGEVPPELLKKAEALKQGAKKNLSPQAFALYGDHLNKLADIKKEGLLVYNKTDKKWYTKKQIEIKAKKELKDTKKIEASASSTPPIEAKQNKDLAFTQDTDILKRAASLTMPNTIGKPVPEDSVAVNIKPQIKDIADKAKSFFSEGAKVATIKAQSLDAKYIAAKSGADNWIDKAKNSWERQKAEVPFEGQLLNKVKTVVSKLRAEEDLPTVKTQRREQEQVKIPTHSSAPSAINAGVSGSKSQSTKSRPINPELDGFINQLFTNTINVFQQSVKSFAIGQTPFQILR